tara:strand:- start:241 stop:624 length:384 start_codon:yes stop_codon:yes gene_type:complete
MSSNVRFVDSLKVGAYTDPGNSGGNIDILNNVNNFVLTATGNSNQINGNSLFIFDGTNLGIGGASTGARFEINDDTGSDLLLIKNASDQGIKVNSEGVFQLIEFSSLPSTAPEGGLAISSNNFYVGL